VIAISSQDLLLFDIDGTLIRRCTAHVKAFSAAIETIYTKISDFSSLKPHGKTDPSLVIEALRLQGWPDDRILPRLDDCLKLIETLFSALVHAYPTEAYEDAAPFLQSLVDRNFHLGLVTGNLESIAYLKLEQGGLGGFFRVGGFGSDDQDRTRLVRLAMERAAEKLGCRPAPDRVFLFGDTPYDVKAGREAGVKTVGVATSIFSKEDLSRAGADFITGCLKDAETAIRPAGG
jgi:phosphoglycolate phosphatase-like HAD superfamily hydrolase